MLQQVGAMAKRMKQSHGAVLIAALVSIIMLLGKVLLGLFLAALGVVSGTIGIALLIIMGISSLLISGPFHTRLRRFVTHRAQIRTFALLSLLAATVWLILLLLPDIHVALGEAATTTRPLWQSALLLAAAFVILLKAVDIAVDKAAEFAQMLGVSPFLISFFLVGVISALPESTIAVVANLQGDANGAASALLASNVADLALIFGLVALLLRGASVKSEALKKDVLYLPILLLPLILMFDGALSRLDGIILIAGGLLFFGVVASQENLHRLRWPEGWSPVVTLLALVGSLALMLAAASITVTTASHVGVGLRVPSVVISVLVVGIGVCLPELLFAIRSAWQHHEGLALGNVLSVVMIDATIMLGVAATLRPMAVDAGLFLVTNLFMAFAAICIIYFSRSVKRLHWQEGVVLLAIYSAYIYIVVLR